MGKFFCFVVGTIGSASLLGFVFMANHLESSDVGSSHFIFGGLWMMVAISLLSAATYFTVKGKY